MELMDFEIVNGGSVSLIIPLTREGRRWLDDSIGEDALYLGQGLAVEARYLGQIVGGILSSGLTIVGEEQ
jgi:hypothetical protein